MEITLRRHSTTRSNLERRYSGSTDHPLCAEGVALAEGQPKRPEVAKVYTSGLRRTAQTARVLYPNAALHPVPGLDEMSFGIFEGRSWEEMQDDPAYTAWVNSGGLAPCPEGEDRPGFIRRCCAAFREILEEARAEGADSVHIVAHGGTIMAILSEYGRPARDYYEWLAPNCGGYRLRLERGGDIPALHLIEEIEVL